MPSSVPPGAGLSARDWSWLFPGGELRLAAFIVRLPWQLPINSGSSFAFMLDGDLGPAWDQLAEMSPVKGGGLLVDREGKRLVQNLRQPFASVRVGQRLRDLRNARGLSQSQLGAPFTRAHISAIEKGKITPSLAALIHLAKVLGVSVRELIPLDLET